MIDVDYNEYKATLEENMQLIQENHKLKERYDNLKKEHRDTITRNEDYRARIDKAIEYMQIFADFDSCMINGKSFQKAIDILKGSDKE